MGARHRWIATASLALSGAAVAAHLQVSPTTLTLRPDQNAAVIQLGNEGSETLYGQVRVYDWDQRDGEDVLEPTRALLASPPLLEIAPGAQQIVRLVRPGGAKSQSEQAYRILIDEIPDPNRPPPPGITVRLRYSVPLFVGPSGEATPLLTWRLSRSASAWVLEAINQGTKHAQVSAVRLLGGNGVHEVDRGLLGYVLPGRTRRWKLALDLLPPTLATLRIQARINASPVEAAVQVVGLP